MSKNQISKPKSNFDRVSQKLIVIFGFIAAIITMLWFVYVFIEGKGGAALFRGRHIQAAATPFALTISGLLIAKAIIYIKHKQHLPLTIANMLCGVVIFIVAIAFLAISYFVVNLRSADVMTLLRRMIKYILIFQICVIWALSYNLMQLRNKVDQSIQSIKKNNAIIIIVLGCLIIPIYSFVFSIAFLERAWTEQVIFARQLIYAFYFLIALVMSLQILIICLTQKQNKKNKIILLSICIGFVLVFYAFTKEWRAAFFRDDLNYFVFISGLATTSLCIPVFIKTK